MTTLIKISWRNIWRNRIRSLVIITAIVLGLLGGVFSVGMRLGVEVQQFNETVENQISHIQLHNPEFIANPEAHNTLQNGMAMADELKQMPEVKTISPRLVLDGMIASATMNSGVRIKGVDPQMEAPTTQLDELITEGTFFQEQGRIPSIIIGERLASNLNAAVGSRLVLTFQDIHGEIVSASFRVEALYAVTSVSFQERTVFVNRENLQNLVGSDNAITEIAVMLHSLDDYRNKTEKIATMFPHAEVRHWADLSPSLYFALEFLNKNMIWIVGIIILGVSFGLLNTILMSVLERTNELGVLMAIGMKKIKVFGMVVTETTLLSIIGGISGIILSYIMVLLLNINGIDMSGAGGEGLAEFGYSSLIFLEVPAKLYYQMAIVVIGFAILAAIYPAWKAITLQPAEAVRQE